MKKIDLRLNKIPKISVILSFFNNRETLEESLNSVFSQSFKNFELILISDGSIDGSNKIAERFLKKKNNILFFKSKHNMGLTKMLNLGIKYSRGEFIARQDADDISLYSRFKNQVNYLTKKGSVDVIGSNAKYVFKNKLYSIKMPREDLDIKKKLLFRNPLIHSSIMLRKKIFSYNKLYNEQFIRCQDYELWLRLKNIVKFYNIQKNLVKRNVKPGNFKIRDLILTTKARFTHCNFFLSLILFLRDSIIFVVKKILNFI